jgi:plastocyanin
MPIYDMVLDFFQVETFVRTTLIAVFLTFASAAGAADLDVSGVAQTAGKPQPNAVVWLEASAKVPVKEGPRPVMDQRNLQFGPKVLVVPVGSTVEFPNNDRVFHNVFSFKDGKRFDLGLYPIGSRKLVQFEKAGVSRLFCNIHPQMAAYVVVVDSSYFAVSGDDGGFTLKGVPPGTYTYRAWRAGSPEVVTGKVVAESGRPMEVRWQ